MRVLVQGFGRVLIATAAVGLCPLPARAGLSQATTAAQPTASARSAPQEPELWPGTRYDPRIPTFKSVLGHDVGEEITSPAEIQQYLDALAKAAPERTRLIEYARTWEGRPLHLLVIASPERIARLDAIKADLKKLGDPRNVAAGELDRLVKELPVVVWLMHAVHGNEISSSDAALAEAYHLLAAQDEPVADIVRREALVLIDPLQNPDGRARFVFQNLLGRAAEPDPYPASAEHDEPWPGGRSNHYLFDMNRDWFAQSQPETRGRTAIYLQFFPQVVVDLHEMGGNSTYYFAPPADPLNPYISKAQVGWFDTFGRANAGRFDARGFAYFNREQYDSFYPGYGESWPMFQGSVGMTYEQASARGLRWRREDESMLTYRDGILHHFTAALTTCETAAKNREHILRDYLDYRRTAIQDGEKGPIRAYVLPPGTDPSRSADLAQLLARQGFDVQRAEASFALGATTCPAGTFIVPLAQPGARLLRNLMDPQVQTPDPFLKEQDRRRKKRLPDQFYDLTGWSLPLVYDVQVVNADRLPGVQTARVTGEPNTRPVTLNAKVGFLLPWGSGTAATVVEALEAGIRVRTADLPFTLGGRQYPGGTAIVRLSDNSAAVGSALASMAAKHGAEIVPIDSAYTEAGISLGSNEVASLTKPRVLLAWDAPTSSQSAGFARYVLERRFGQRVTAVRVNTLPRITLQDFDVIVLPSGSYGPALAGDAVRRLKDWISAGGTLITLAEASRWVARENVGLLDTRTELRGGRPEAEPAEKEQGGAGRKPDAAPQPIDLEKAVQPERERPENTPGALLRVVLDQEHWLAAGTDGEIQTIVEGTRVFTPITLDKGRNVGVYQTRDKLVASGVAWDEAQSQLAQKAFLVHQPIGRGHVIAFAEDPNYRAFSEATELLFINAVLLGPAH